MSERPCGTARKTLQLLLAGHDAPSTSLAKKEVLPPIAAAVREWRLTVGEGGGEHSPVCANRIISYSVDAVDPQARVDSSLV